MRTIIIPERKECRYTFAELGPKAQDKALEHWARSEGETFDGTDGDDCYKAVGAALGFTVGGIYWSGFWSQDDGACFVGTWNAGDARKAVEKMRDVLTSQDVAKMAVEAARLSKIVADWTEANPDEANGDERLYYIRHSGNYSHEYTMRAESSDYATSAAPDLTEDILKLARAYARWIYRTLEADYDYRTGRASLLAAETDGCVEFGENGTIYYV